MPSQTDPDQVSNVYARHRQVLGVADSILQTARELWMTQSQVRQALGFADPSPAEDRVLVTRVDEAREGRCNVCQVKKGGGVLQVSIGRSSFRLCDPCGALVAKAISEKVRV